VLHGVTEQQGRAAAVELRQKTHREKSADAQGTVPHLLALAADPLLQVMGDRIDTWTDPEQSRGGRPRKHPTWVMVLFGACISIFGSASATSRNLADPAVWNLVCERARPNLPDGAALPARGPTRDQWQYFTRRLEDHQEQFQEMFEELACLRARQVGLADPSTARISRPDREHTLGIDGKVFSSPQGTLATDPVDRRTGEIRAARTDPARGMHREGGCSDAVWGAKYAIESVRSSIQGLRITTGVQCIHADGRGEVGAFVDLVVRCARSLPGLTAVVADGAMRGASITAIQTATGIPVVSPPRRRSQKRGGIKIGDTYYAARPLPPSKARTKAFACCGGHDLWAAGGGIHEKVTTVDGTHAWLPVPRGQIRREQRADGTWAIYAEHRLPCSSTDATHTWHESLTPTADDARADFNRAEYLRALPRDDPDHARVYGMRADTESLHAQLEYAFHKQRLPAWGEHRQTLVITFAAVAQNAWALHVWNREVARQHPPPDLEAA
jgi:hypothetical protein